MDEVGDTSGIREKIKDNDVVIQSGRSTVGKKY